MSGVEALDDDYLLAPFKEPQKKKKRSREETDTTNDDREAVEADLEEAEPTLAEHDESEEVAPATTQAKKGGKKQKKQQQPQQPKEKKPKKDRSGKTLELRKEIFELAQATEWSDESGQLPEERSLENLLTFVTAMREVDQGKQILIVTPSAERAIAIIPVLKPIGKVGKVFARHMKLEEQIKAQELHQFKVSVGAASRIVKLVEAGAIPAEKVGFVILDGTSMDKKERCLFSIPELKADLVSALKLLRHSNVIVF
ncbi:UNVERIFIED_CONTAM: cms1 ribosomal small subunit [Siphonaria sp. JEL0065]|nr:cms1 ribosomal small subunit [Siphonaria sp. JEL0065]